MRLSVVILSCFLFSAPLSGCADRQLLRLPDKDNERQQSTKTVVRIVDPAGPIPAPQLPPELASAAGAAPAAGKKALAGTPGYTVESLIEDHARSGAPIPPDEIAALKRDFEKSSILYRLADSPPERLAGLEQRLSVALQEARDVLRSRGYYAGRVAGAIDNAPGGGAGHVVRVTFMPGPRYRMGKTRVIFSLPAGAPDAKRLPRSLEEAGLPAGAPAATADVLAAVDRTRDLFLQNGYPFAVVASTRYIADHAARELEAEVRLAPGAFVRMGRIERKGAHGLRGRYIEALQTWDEGDPWRQEAVEAFRDALRQSGLFRSIELAPGEVEQADGKRPVVTRLESAPERTLSGAIKYHSDFGPGVQGNWEHRNLSGRGDSLRLTMPLWLDMQELTANYRLPFFLRRDQDFIAGGGLLNQDTDAYRLTSGAVSGGIERRLSRRWRGSAKLSAEGGSIKEPDKASRDYWMFGLPLGLIYDNTENPLNAEKGQRLLFFTTPYTGAYDGGFSILRSRLEGQAFFPLLGDDSLVLALRGVVGVISGASSDTVPPSVRLYSGGGGSVRGYEYQSLGPRNADNDPLGGGSLIETSAEARWKLSPEWGLVAFVDGGTVYEDVFADTGEIMRWGAGVGARYYTAIGPVRFDVATPLNPRDDDNTLQFYISIGQSF